MKEIALKESIKNRRSFYELTDKSPISDKEIQKIVEHVFHYAPSPFNSQSAQAVILLGEHHRKLWEITKAELKKVSQSEESWKRTEEKVNTSFLSGYGTVLFFEDTSIVKGLQERMPAYSDKFLQWSEHSSAIVQILTWMALENEGLGASLQHYNPLIDKAIQNEWNISNDWRLIAQMPFGIANDKPEEKPKIPIEKRVMVFK